LIADCPRFAQKAGERRVYLRRGMQPEVVHVVARRKRLDLRKSRMLRAPCEHQVTVDESSLRRELGKRHASLKSDPRFFRQDAHLSDRARRFGERVEDCSNLAQLAREVSVELAERGTAMRLVSGRKPPPALSTAPKRRACAHRDLAHRGAETARTKRGALRADTPVGF